MLAGCGGSDSAEPTTNATPPVVRSAALKTLLPARVEGRRLEKRSASGARVLSGGNAFSVTMKRILARNGKRPRDLDFANARDATGDLELGVWRVRGLTALALADAIVESTRPNAPGLSVSATTLGGRPVKKLVYASGATLYLSPRRDLVYYVGTRNEALAARILRELR